MTEPHSEWNDSYLSAEPAPWDIGRPQQAFVRLADEGKFAGRVLDAGCGSGEHTILAAASGAEATGMDISAEAIRKARAKAQARGVLARFVVADLRSLASNGVAASTADPGERYDVVIDSGLFHVFGDEDRARYVTGLAAALRPGGRCYVMCFSDRQPGDFGPRRVSEGELRAAFASGWSISGIEAAAFEINPVHGFAEAMAWLAEISRLPG